MIRKAIPEDKSSLEEMVRAMGGDYLPEVFERWVKDNFYVIELNGKIIGTGKITLLPNKVGWMEGLRVHPEYRGRGLGKLMHNFLIERGSELAEEGVIDALEFATNQYKSLSAHMALKTGFHVIAEFHHLRMKVSEFEPKKPMASGLSLNDLSLEVIPLGWKFVHKSRESVKWLVKHGEVYKISGIKFLVPREGRTFTPLSFKQASIGKILRGISWIAKDKGFEEFKIMLPGFIGINDLNLRQEEEYPGPPVAVFRKDLGSLKPSETLVPPGF